MVLRRESVINTLVDQNDPLTTFIILLIPTYVVAFITHQRFFLLQSAETLTENHKWAYYKDQWLIGIQTPKDTSLPQLLYSCFKEHLPKRGNEDLRAISWTLLRVKLS